jgi:Na+/melibiose symporter-like transporter
LSAVRNPDSTRALTAVFALMPIMFYAPAIFLLWGFPLTPDRQRRIRVLVHKRAIKHQRQRDRRAAATVKAA